MARISRKNGGAFYPDIEGGSPGVEVKEHTDDVKHSGSDHRQGILTPIYCT